MTRQYAPVLDYLLSTLRVHRASGRIHRDVAAGLDAYIGHVMRLADERALSGPRPSSRPTEHSASRWPCRSYRRTTAMLGDPHLQATVDHIEAAWSA